MFARLGSLLDAFRGLDPNVRFAIWLAAGAAAVVVAGWAVDLLWRRVLVPLAARTRARIDGLLLEHCRRPVLALVASAGLNLIYRVAAEDMPWSGGVISRFCEGALYTLGVLAAAFLVYGVVAALCDWYLAAVAARTQSGLDSKLVPVFRRVAKALVLFLAVTVILGHFDVKIAALLGAAGVASLAVALAAQETVANMISGFTILVDRPFRLGDRVQLADGTVGDVHEIGLRSTKILTFDNTLLILPNKEISGARIVNLSYPDPRFALRRTFTVAYGSDVAKVKGLLVEIARSHPKVVREPAPAAFFKEFGESALEIVLVCHVADYREAFGVQDEINMEVYRRFAAERIEIPFPQRDVRIRGGAPAN